MKELFMLTVIGKKVVEYKFYSKEDRKNCCNLLMIANDNLKFTFWETYEEQD